MQNILALNLIAFFKFLFVDRLSRKTPIGSVNIFKVTLRSLKAHSVKVSQAIGAILLALFAFNVMIVASLSIHT